MKMKKSLIVLIFLALVSCKGKTIEQQKKENNRTDGNGTENYILVAETDIEQKLNELGDSQKDIINYDWDDSTYNDKATVEFSLCGNEIEYCLYHNIRKINGLNLDNYTEIGNWCKKVMDDITVTWNYENGAIVNIETESEKYETTRGAKVGDSLSIVMDLYKNDSDIFKWNNENSSYEKEDNKENDFLKLYYGDEGIMITATNYIDEEIMYIKFYAEDGKVNKIEIKCGS